MAQDTRARIEATALTLLTEQGIDATSLRQIPEHLGITRGHPRVTSATCRREILRDAAHRPARPQATAVQRRRAGLAVIGPHSSRILLREDSYGEQERLAAALAVARELATSGK